MSLDSRRGVGAGGEGGTTGQQACLVASRVSNAEKAMSEGMKGVTQCLAGGSALNMLAVIYGTGEAGEQPSIMKGAWKR